MAWLPEPTVQLLLSSRLILLASTIKIYQVLAVIHRSIQVLKQVWIHCIPQYGRYRMQSGRGTKNATLPVGGDTTIWSRAEGVGWGWIVGSCNSTVYAILAMTFWWGVHFLSFTFPLAIWLALASGMLGNKTQADAFGLILCSAITVRTSLGSMNPNR